MCKYGMKNLNFLYKLHVQDNLFSFCLGHQLSKSIFHPVKYRQSLTPSWQIVRNVDLSTTLLSFMLITVDLLTL